MISLLVCATPALAGARDDAAATIDALHDTLITAMKQADALGFDGRRALIGPAVNQAFDLEFMAIKSLGPHARELSAEQRNLWIETFGVFVTSNLARQFDGYSDERFETRMVEDAPRETLIVQTVLVRPDDDDVRLNYRLRLVDDPESSAAAAVGAATVDGAAGGADPTGAGAVPASTSELGRPSRWRVIDIYSNGTVSELALRRSEFSGLYGREGFDDLVSTVIAKSEHE